jgi:glycogen(starch) synthase
MRILIVNSEYPPVGGGASNASAHIARELVQLGQEVTVLTSAYAQLPREQQDAGVRVLRVPSLRRNADRSNATEQGVFMILASLLGLWTMRQVRPQVVLAFFGVPSGVAAWFWSFFFRVPYIVCLRGGDVPGFRPYDFAKYHRVLAPLLRRVWRKAAAVVANSEGLRQLGNIFEPKLPIAVIPNGVDLSAFSGAQTVREGAHMLFVGRVVYQKGLDLLLTALQTLSVPGWKLTIVGDGPSADRLKQQAAELGIIQSVQFVGWQTRDRLAAYLKEADLFVYPSRHEGMPNAVLEAMASGLPVLATRIAGSEELVTSDTGVLVPSEDSAALGSALEQLLRDAALLQRMGSAARKRVEEQYSWRFVTEKFLALIEAAVASE